MNLSRDWKVYAYLSLGAALGAIELVAFRNGTPGDTISERVWALGWPLATVVGLGMMVLGIHFAFQGRKVSDHEFPVEDFEANKVHILTEAELDELLQADRAAVADDDIDDEMIVTKEHMAAWADGRESHLDEEEDG